MPPITPGMKIAAVTRQHLAHETKLLSPDSTRNHTVQKLDSLSEDPKPHFGNSISRGIVKASSDLIVSSRALIPSSTIVPLDPVFWRSWCGWVVVDEEEDEAAEDSVVVSVGEEVGNAFEGDEPADGADNEPQISKRLRSFHTV
ncbi:uncharacterized protein PgNI_00947 [Pyricularia grisea]|uniref:Uncharacterized protein n=1 Tax=Pyricularia grisea TaxID=148305 RepID=A0A6P8BL02_PYRGI|nr:uncharacterized protein PgNI_00947 [Pyricularia grisea]TLD17478.1 hypothetical protein PgNI_00947 [Pyricularia grisea]